MGVLLLGLISVRFLMFRRVIMLFGLFLYIGMRVYLCFIILEIVLKFNILLMLSI